MQKTCSELRNKKRGISSRALTMAVLVVTLLDVASGWGVAYALLTNNFHTILGGMVSKHVLGTLESSEQLVTWLKTGVPGGLKLNTPLNHFLGDKFLIVLGFVKNICLLAEPCIWWTVTIIVVSSIAGLTVGLTLLYDFLNFLNVCTVSLFIFAARIFYIQLSALRSLARLFMGNKLNKLRMRVDSCDFDMSRLLLGTVLFTILLFLVPTTAMYYLVFAFLRMKQLAIQTPLRMGTLIINRLVMILWSVITSTLNEESIGNLKLCLQRSYDNSNRRTCVTKVYGVLNGREYSLEKLKKLVVKLPVEEILYPNKVAYEFQHNMLIISLLLRELLLKIV